MDNWLFEDGSNMLLEDASGFWILEGGESEAQSVRACGGNWHKVFPLKTDEEIRKERKRLGII